MNHPTGDIIQYPLCYAQLATVQSEIKCRHIFSLRNIGSYSECEAGLFVGGSVSDSPLWIWYHSVVAPVNRFANGHTVLASRKTVFRLPESSLVVRECYLSLVIHQDRKNINKTLSFIKYLDIHRSFGDNVCEHRRSSDIHVQLIFCYLERCREHLYFEWTAYLNFIWLGSI